MATSSQQPFPPLDPTCILWCNAASTIIVKQHLTDLNDALFFPSFLNECVKAVNLFGNFTTYKKTGGLDSDQNAIWTCLHKHPINADELIAIMQKYAAGKYKRGATRKGVVDLTSGAAGDETLAAGQLELYNKVFRIGEREKHRKQREADAGLVPLERPHPGLERVRKNRQAGTERRKKRKFGDKSGEGEDGDGDGEEEEALNTMRKMKKGLPTYTFADEEAKIEGKSHGKLVVTGKGKEKMEDEDEIE
ncbi:hypothetical protein D6C86_02693 [Aureobasidium pullulans]|uniref:Uncharacterized protein n=1 Tax=Aureobasidium pullulans TaxID=5580 RepID=A0A4S9WG53_AURPU|nr:hypothetical protein D6C94_01742 [Aureobasidium pullulans]THZ44559.1 hypothetical protein D6C87_03497 [Aureobasidium pullulans]THZ59033.1 hypothetical protein D6C88_08962 [Aureobasidium pullulans]THZ64215.1 hypothetical protein D6C86_02693 [Aureobasidium pullulans]